MARHSKSYSFFLPNILIALSQLLFGSHKTKYKYKKNKHPISTIPSKIRAGIRVAIQPWGIRNLTDFPRYPQYRLKRLLLVLIPAGQSCQNQPPGMPTTCHYFYSQQFGE